MELIKKDKLGLSIKNNYDYPFEVSESGVYLIEIIATAKSWWQNLKNFKSFFNDDDLTLKIDAIEFPKLNGKKGFFDGEVAWNGNNLKGLFKTNIFIIKLNKGSHVLKFLADKNPILESITIFKVDEKEIKYLPEENNPAQDGDRRQWITIISISLPARNLNIRAGAKKYPKDRDDDDIKLIINGVVQKNESDKSHRNWFWCGKILNGQEKEFNQEVNFENKINYIELWADRMPVLNEIKIILGQPASSDEGNKKFGKIALYEDIEDTENVNLRSEPKIKENVIAQIKNGEAVEIIEELVEGAYVQNKSNIWHKIKYQGLDSYILSSYVEIDGQARDLVIEKIKMQAGSYGIDENYAVALAGCESRYKPHAVSHSGALGIFQLTNIARQQLREKLNYEINDEESFDVNKNIEAGVIYLQWLFGIYKGVPDYYKKVTAAWNAGSSLISIEGAINYDKIINSVKKEEAQKLVESVELNRNKKDWGHIIAYSCLIFLMMGAMAFGALGTFSDKTGTVLGSQVSSGNTAGDIRFEFENPYAGIKNISVSGYRSGISEWKTKVVVEYNNRIEEKVYNGFLKNAYLFNVLFSFDPQLFIVREQGKFIDTSILIYDDKNEIMKEGRFVHKDQTESSALCCSNIILKPFTNGVQYDLAVLNLSGDRESVYEYDFLNPSEDAFIEKE